MNARRWFAHISVGLLLAASCGCGGHAAGGEDGGDSDAGVIAPVRIGAVAERTFADVVTASGQWRSGGDLVISVPTAGVIESLSVRVGDRVLAGQRLGALISRDSWAALQGAELLRREASDPAARAEGERALVLARRELVRLPLRAPQSGFVVRRSIEPGAQVAEGAEILALVPDRAVVFEAHVPSADAGRVREGQSAVVAGADAAARATTVQRVLPMASGADQSTLVWLATHDSAAPPALDRFGTATIAVGASRRAIAVPDSAIVEDDLTGEHRVAVVDSAGRVAWTPVVPGLAAEGWREIVRTRLAAGTRIVIEGQRGLPGGTRVTPRP